MSNQKTNYNHMKYLKFLFLILVLVLVESQCYSQSKSKKASQLKIEPKVFDLGKIYEIDGKVKMRFVITNISKKPYILNYSYSGCGCIAAEITRKPLMPNEMRAVEVEFNPKRRPGIFHKVVSLISDNKSYNDDLEVIGEVIPRPKSIEELYPIKVMDGVSISSDLLPLGIISQNEKHIGVINCYNGSNESVNLKIKTVGDKLGTAVISSEKIAPNRSSQIQFNYDLINGKYYGELKNEIELYINGKKWEEDIKVNALVMFNFFEMTEKEREAAPRAIVVPREYIVNFGERKEVEIFNNGKTDLKILAVIPSGDNIEYKLTKNVIEPNKTGLITLYLKETKEKLNFGDVTVMFNSPDSPIVIVKLKNTK